MRKHQSYSLQSIVDFSNYPKCYEPKPRIHGGRLKHHGHRFPIKNGINAFEAAYQDYQLMIKDMIAISPYMR